MRGTTWTFSTIFFAVLVVCGVVIGLANFSTEILIDNYPTANVTNYSTISHMDSLENRTDDIYESVRGAQETPFSSAYYAVKGGWNTVLLMFESLDIFNTMITDVSIHAGVPIPTWFMVMLSIAVSLIMIFAALMFIGKVNI